MPILMRRGEVAQVRPSVPRTRMRILRNQGANARHWHRFHSSSLNPQASEVPFANLPGQLRALITSEQDDRCTSSLLFDPPFSECIRGASTDRPPAALALDSTLERGKATSLSVDHEVPRAASGRGAQLGEPAVRPLPLPVTSPLPGHLASPCQAGIEPARTVGRNNRSACDSSRMWLRRSEAA